MLDVDGDVMTGKIKDHPIFCLDLSLHLFKHGLHVYLGCVEGTVDGVAMGLAEELGDVFGVFDGGGEAADAVLIGVDADYESMAMGEGEFDFFCHF